MRTEKQHAASRANGAKSQGPTTPEGKAASSTNATTHGLTARNPLLLNVEQQAAFQNYLSEYVNHLKPLGPVETDIAEELVAIQWRRQRAEVAEAALVQLTMDRMAADVDRQITNCPHATRIAMAMEHLEDKGRTLANFQRHSLRLSRQFLRLHKTLREIQAERRKPVRNSIRRRKSRRRSPCRNRHRPPKHKSDKSNPATRNRRNINPIRGRRCNRRWSMPHTFPGATPNMVFV